MIPDCPTSRLRFLLEVLPEQGFGHVDILASPAARSNIFYQFASNDAVHYRMGYRIAENMKYLLSRLGDRRPLDDCSGTGATALGSAALHGNDVVCRVLLEAGVDPNAGLARTPLNHALEWLKKCQTREQKALTTTQPGEKRQALKLRKQAEETVRLIRAAGGIDEMRFWNPIMQLNSGNFKLPEPQVGYISASGSNLALTIRSGVVGNHVWLYHRASKPRHAEAPAN
jgi:hypothetical protein